MNRRVRFTMLGLFVLSLISCNREPVQKTTVPKDPEPVAVKRVETVGNKIIASVNGTDISETDLVKELANILIDYDGLPKAELKQLEPVLKKQALDNLIDFYLLLNAAGNAGFAAESDVVDKRYKELENQADSTEKFSSILTELGITEESLRHELASKNMVERFLLNQFESLPLLGQTEAKEYYTHHPEKFTVQEQVRANHILIAVIASDSDSEKMDKRKQLESIRSRILKGEDFALLAREFSDCPSSISGGDLGFFGKNEMDPEVEAVAFSLSPGRLSDVFETTNGFHLIQSVEKRPAGIIPFDDVSEDIIKDLEDAQHEKCVAEILRNLKESAEIIQHATPSDGGFTQKENARLSLRSDGSE